MASACDPHRRIGGALVARLERKARDAERGEKIVEEALDLVRGTELDKGIELDALGA